MTLHAKKPLPYGIAKICRALCTIDAAVRRASGRVETFVKFPAAAIVATVFSQIVAFASGEYTWTFRMVGKSWLVPAHVCAVSEKSTSPSVALIWTQSYTELVWFCGTGWYCEQRRCVQRS